jgi:hypothetical protein
MEQNDNITEAKLLDKYQKVIDYYWGSSRHNKVAYKRARFSIIILGAVLTLISSIASANFIESSNLLKVAFAILTPILAALLAIIGGFAQSFHWGATWRDMVVNAQKLEKARDIFLAAKPEERDLKKELELMHSMLITETESFFQRVLDSEVKPAEKEKSAKS